MKKNSKAQISQSIIQYLLKSTRYSLNDIAELSDASLKTIRSIYYGHQIQLNPLSELQLVKMYHFVLELKLSEQLWAFYPFGEMS